jgi:hypothetical protein
VIPLELRLEEEVSAEGGPSSEHSGMLLCWQIGVKSPKGMVGGWLEEARGTRKREGGRACRVIVSQAGWVGWDVPGGGGNTAYCWSRRSDDQTE